MIKTVCDKCGERLSSKNGGYGARKVLRPWWVCGCGATTLLDTEKEYAEWECPDCGNIHISKYAPIPCPKCDGKNPFHKFIRYISAAKE
jgi:rubrerythrin